MKRVMFIKLAVDLVMTVLLFAAMANRIAGNIAHEIIGLLIFALFIAHHILNHRWYRTVLKGRYNLFRVQKITVNLLLVVTMTMVLVSAVFISQIVFDFIPAEGSLFIRQIHVASAYWGFILMSVHMGMHGEMIMQKMRRMIGFSDASRIRLVVLRIAAVLIVIYGVKASFDRNIGSKLIMYYAYDTWNIDKSIFDIVISYLSIMGMYICATHYILKRVLKHNKLKAYSSM